MVLENMDKVKRDELVLSMDISEALYIIIMA